MVIIIAIFSTQVNGVNEGLEIVSVTSAFSGHSYNWLSDPASLGAAWRLSPANVKTLSIDVKADADRRNEVAILEKHLKRHQRTSEAPASMVISVRLSDNTLATTSLVYGSVFTYALFFFFIF